MDDGLKENVGEPEAPDQLSNGVGSPAMANSEAEDAEEPATTKLNGDTDPVSNPESYSSESDALVIDESASSAPVPHFNPYFNESLFELTQQHHSKLHKHKKNKHNPKLREYAQYLGLQPTVQFKCSKCGRPGFESLTTLNEHIINCTDEPITVVPNQDNSSGFKLTRKVFLCSACGTYYENWNLYLHMIEVHRRYLCLYCLGMFSVLDDLCGHIQSRHNLEPGYKNTPDDFFSAYQDPCYLVCCECKQQFNEQENFFYHNCVAAGKKNQKSNNKLAAITNSNSSTATTNNKTVIRPEDHVTGDTFINGDSFDETIQDSLVGEGKETVVNTSSEKETAPTTSSEIVYSSDDELNFKGWNDCGEPVYLVNKVNSESPEPVMDDEEVIETRKVPKLSLKLKPGSFPQIEQHSEEENEVIESEPDTQLIVEEEPVPAVIDDAVPKLKIAGDEIAIIELQLEQPLDKFNIRVLLQKCLKATAYLCIYCNHARKIAVNGRELALHAIAEHRFSAVVSSITAEELIPESFVTRIKESLPELDGVFFNLETSPTSNEGVTFSHIFECFQCRYSTTVHKELYLHNRKLHAKNLLLCIMCKSNFYSYSELICHLCPGVYILDYDVSFKCCMCVSDDLPSAFRLMVHLRKRHHVCDVCLEMCHNQYKLSNHVWKHKLHHFCYRCCIAYRNKPDITRHLFWKHGTESVLCKKCLQKKWPHVYHFCVPPTSFLCEECNLTFSRAVSLKVHKRIHTDEKPHACTIDDCQEKFISKKLLEKHEHKHNEPPPEENNIEIEQDKQESTSKESHEGKSEELKNELLPEPEKVKPKVDVYDLPELNLSESDSSDSEEETGKKTAEEESNKAGEIVEEETEPIVLSGDEPEVLENIWDDFKTYQANKEKFDHLFEPEKTTEVEEVPTPVILTSDLALLDHDYCIDPENKPDVSFTEVKPDLSQSVDHDYCSAKDPKDAQPEQVPPPDEEKKKSSSSGSSSDSDSSSCSCGPNCSCSSSSGSSSSSSDSSDSDSSTEEGRKRQQLRRERRRQKKNNKPEPEPPKPELGGGTNRDFGVVPEIPILESDLETSESETDEEFYDKQPQKLAKKILEEKRNQLLAGIEQTPNGTFLENSRSTTPNLPDEPVKIKKKSKSKKKKKKKRNAARAAAAVSKAPYYQYYQPPTVAPITLSLSRNSPGPSPHPPKDESRDEDGNLRASKRRRVPNKFYGYSSDEEEKVAGKWRKVEPPVPPPPMVVPPITIKNVPPVPPPAPIRRMPPIKLKTKHEEIESEADSNDSSGEGRNIMRVNPDALYCYCKCPYDEVSEMIGCDSRDCEIEWFHFECVGIMVPPKGHWYCPECRKKRQQKRDALKLKTKTM